MELTPSISEYVDKKVGFLEKFMQGGSETAFAEVEVGRTTNHHKTGDVFRAELNLAVNGKNIYVQAEKDDLYAAIDEMKDRAERECVGSKGRKSTVAKRIASRFKKMIRRGK